MSFDLGTAKGTIELDYEGGIAAAQAKDDIDDIGDKAKHSEREVSKLERSLTKLRAGLLTFGGGSARGAGFTVLAVGAANAVVSTGQLLLNVAATVNSLASLLSLSSAIPGALAGAAASALVLKAALLGIGGAFKAAFSGDTAKFEKAIKGLAPEARAFAVAFQQAVKPIKDVQQAIQDAAFRGLAPLFTQVFAALLPLRGGLVGLASDFNLGARAVGQFAAQAATVDFLARSIDVARNIVQNLATAIGPVLEGVRAVGTVGLGIFNGLGASIASVATQFGNWLTTIAGSGQLQAWINQAMTTLRQLAGIIENVGSVLVTVFQLAGSQGSSFIAILETATSALRQFTDSAAGQQALTAIFTAIATTANSLAPIFTTLVGIVGGQLAPVLLTVAQVVGPALLTFVQALGPAIAQLTGPLQGVAGGLAEAFLNLAPALQPLGAALGQLLVAVTPLLPLLGQLLADAVTNASTTIGVLVSVLSPLVALIAQTLNAALAALLPLLQQLSTTFLPLFASASQQVLQALEPLIPVLADQFAAAIQQIAPLVPQLAQAFIDMLPAAVQIAVAFAQILTAVAPLIPFLVQLSTYTLQIAAVLAGSLLVGVNLVAASFTILSTAVQAVSTVIGFVIGAFQSAGNAGSSLATTIQTFIVGAFNAVVNFFTALPGRILGALAALPGMLVAAVQGWFNGMAFAIGFGIGLIIGQIQAIPGRISAILNILTNVIPGIIGNAWNAAMSATINGVNSVISFVGSLPSRAASAIAGIIGAISNAIHSAMASGASAASSGVAQIGSIIRGIPAAVGSLFGQMAQVGRDIVNGLISGIRSLAGAAADAARSVVSNAIAGAKAALHIGSPSKVFIDIGEDTSRGFVIGLLNLLDRVTKAGELLASGAVQSVATNVTGNGVVPPVPLPVAGTSTSTVTGPTITINQTVNPQPGMTEEQVATISARRLLVALGSVGA